MSDVVPQSRQFNVVGGQGQAEGPPLTPAQAALLLDKVKRLEHAMYNPDGVVQALVHKTNVLEHGHTRQVTAIASVTFVFGLISAIATLWAFLK